jgi:hypothetical protein
MPEDKIPRRTFLEGTSATAASIAIVLATDAKLKSREPVERFHHDTGHVYMYMDENEE